MSDHPPAEPATLHRIVLTGGPCAGKSTSLSLVATRLRDAGYLVLVVPEASTLLLSGGISLAGATPGQLLTFQQAILRAQIALEDGFLAFARAAGQKAVLLCDRGVMDGKGYLDEAGWRELLASTGRSVVELRDQRYDAVIFLVTAADGAEQHYDNVSNPTRYEDVEGARRVDARLRAAWVGHPHLRVIGNATSFEEKQRRVVAAACAVVGLPEPRECERKFLVRRSPALTDMPVPCEEVEIEQVYLTTPEGVDGRVRRRGQHGSWTFTHTVKRPTGEASVRVEIERQIAANEYEALLAHADPARRPVRKVRRVFLHKDHTFELDVFREPRPGLQLLEVELDDPATPVELPPFLDVEREVTGDPAFDNHRLACG